jgi:pimeloyl-ACP methyl ester carboxylesterase
MAIDLAVICVGLYLLCCVFGLFMINALMFHPPAPSYSWDTPDVVNIGGEAAPIAAMWFPCAGTDKVVLYSHGNAEDISDFTGIGMDFTQAGFSVLCYDYPGYGLSVGKPTEQSVYAAAEAAYRFLTGRCGIAPSDIIVLGRSIGSGPACYLAEKFPVGGLVLEAGFTSAPRVMTRVRALPFDPFPNIRRIPNISCPKLFIHGTDDSTIPFSHGKALFAAAKAPKTFLEVGNAGHDDLILVLGEKDYFKVLRTFTDP